MRSRSRAALAVATFVALTLVMDWVPNPLDTNLAHTDPAERLPGTLIHTVAGLGVIAAMLTRRRWLMLLGAFWYSVVLVSACLNWWLPYLTGITVGEIDASSAAEYADNPRVLPAIGDHPIVPDVQHLLIHASIATACVLSWVAFVRTRRSVR